MSVRVDVLPGEDSNGPDVVLSWPAVANSATLEHESHLGADVYLTLDLARPSDCHRLRVRDWSRTAVPLLQALAGRKATKSLSVAVEQWSAGGQIGNQSLYVDSTQATPWLRLAVIHSLDRWLHLPLDQALLHAELAVGMLRAALSLPREAEARDGIIDEALGWARRASEGVTQFLQELPGRTWPLPTALHRSLQGLVDGYASLRAMVFEPDVALMTVVDAWKEVLNRSRTSKGDERSQGHVDRRDPSDKLRPTAAVANVIDPRHVRARVFNLGNKPQAAEIALTSAEMHGQDAVQIRVPSFQRHIDPEIAQRLMARLIHRTSGAEQCFAPLIVRAPPTASNEPSFFECTMPLRGSRLEDVRADVFDALFGIPPADNDVQDDLLRTREAMLLLREWRGHVAQAQLGSLDDGELPDLDRLARLNPPELLRDLSRSAEDALPPMVRGPGEPLVAELAAAFQNQTA